MAVQIQIRRDTAANWTSNNPTLAAGELGFETDTGKLKIGDGTTEWTSLDYIDVAIDHNTLTNTHNLTTDIDHDQLTNYVANEHIDHSTVSIMAGDGLTGGGDLTNTRTLSFDPSYSPTFAGLDCDGRIDHNVTLTVGTTKGIISNTVTNHTSDQTYFYGMSCRIRNASAYQITNNVTALVSIIEQNGTGLISTARAGSFQIQSTNSGDITIGRVLEVNSPYFTSTGTIGTLYGLQIRSQAHANVTTAYAIYQEGADDINYFAGNIGLGTTSFGTNAAKVLAIGNGTAPTSSPADCVQLWSGNRGGIDGKAGLFIRAEDGTQHVFADRVGIGITNPTSLLHVGTGHGVKLSGGDPSWAAGNEIIRTGYTAGIGDWTDLKTPSNNNNSTVIRLTHTLRVGIKETSPDYTLDVNGSFGFHPGNSVTPVDNGDVVIEFTNNTTLTFKAKGSDGTVRTATLTLS